MPPKAKGVAKRARGQVSKPANSTASKKLASKTATSKPLPNYVFVVVCGYSYRYNDYLDEEVKVVATYASLDDANGKVIDLWRSSEELCCGLLYRHKARDGKENDGSFWWYHEHSGWTSVSIEKLDLAKESGDKLIVKNGSSGIVDLLHGRGGGLEVIESSGKKPKTWGRSKTDRPKACAQGPATYLYRVPRIDAPKAQATPELKDNSQREGSPKLLKRILGVQAVDNKWKWQVEWANTEISWVDGRGLREKDREELWAFLVNAMDAASSCS